ncbi:MAG: hypothetical protein HUK24_00625 [Sphaerochaetaceae bacterium]|nr:hypothetical protein [Sphaerochaetaceae bacterium]
MMVLILLFLGFALFVGLVMESYKKLLRKDKASLGEIRLVAFLLSLGLGFTLIQIITVNSLPEAVYLSDWLIVPFTIIIYLLQEENCMNFWKPIFKSVVERKLKNE